MGNKIIFLNAAYCKMLQTFVTTQYSKLENKKFSLFLLFFIILYFIFAVFFVLCFSLLLYFLLFVFFTLSVFSFFLKVPLFHALFTSFGKFEVVKGEVFAVLNFFVSPSLSVFFLMLMYHICWHIRPPLFSKNDFIKCQA